MWRSVVVAAVVYGYGHPVFEGVRPGVLDRALGAFHTEVNTAARDGYRAMTSLDQTRLARSLRGYVEGVDGKLRPSNNKSEE